MTPQTPDRPSDLLAAYITEMRGRLDMTAAALADRCAETGAPEITRSVIANIQTGRRDASGRRRRDITVDELTALAHALGMQAPALLAMALREHQEVVSSELCLAAINDSKVRNALRRAATVAQRGGTVWITHQRGVRIAALVAVERA